MDCVARESEQIVSARILAKGTFETDLLQEGIDKVVFLSHLREKVLAFTKG